MLSRENGYIKFTKSEAKRFTKWVEGKNDTVCIEIVGTKLKASQHFEDGKFKDTTFFELECACKCDMLTTFYSKSLKKVCESAWDGGVWFTMCNNMAVFDCVNADVTIIMPYLQEEINCHGEVQGRNTPALDRNTDILTAKIAGIAAKFNIELDVALNLYKMGALVVA